MYAMPSGANSLPATPDNVSTGRKISITMNVANTTALRTSSDARSTTRNASSGVGSAQFSRSRR